MTEDMGIKGSQQPIKRLTPWKSAQPADRKMPAVVKNGVTYSSAAPVNDPIIKQTPIKQRSSSITTLLGRGARKLSEFIQKTAMKVKVIAKRFFDKINKEIQSIKNLAQRQVAKQFPDISSKGSHEADKFSSIEPETQIGNQGTTEEFVEEAGVKLKEEAKLNEQVCRDMMDAKKGGSMEVVVFGQAYQRPDAPYKGTTEEWRATSWKTFIDPQLQQVLKNDEKKMRKVAVLMTQDVWLGENVGDQLKKKLAPLNRDGDRMPLVGTKQKLTFSKDPVTGAVLLQRELDYKLINTDTAEIEKMYNVRLTINLTNETELVRLQYKEMPLTL